MGRLGAAAWRWRRDGAMRSPRRAPGGRWGMGMVASLLLVAAAAPVIAPYDPDEQLDPEAAALRQPGTVLAAVHLAGGRWRLAERARRTPAGLEIERLGRREVLPDAQVVNLAGRRGAAGGHGGSPGHSAGGAADSGGVRGGHATGGPEGMARGMASGVAGVADRRVFLLGSDEFGRDVTSRLLYGARVSLAVGLLSVLLAWTVGVSLGSMAALGGPLCDASIMRGVDALLAFPWLFLMIALSALLHPGTATTICILGATGWMAISRLTRAELRSLQRREFVLAARAMGQRPLAVLFRHLLPNAMTPVLVQCTLQIGNLILLESSLSFLGLGVQPPTPSWGSMLADAYASPPAAWWLAVFPGAALALAVIAFNLLGDELRDALDPRWRGPELAAAPEAAAGDLGTSVPQS
jgi:peptide/nickel transport system permease protein